MPSAKVLGAAPDDTRDLLDRSFVSLERHGDQTPSIVLFDAYPHEEYGVPCSNGNTTGTIHEDHRHKSILYGAIL